jgi:hypothetical protein
MEFIRTKKRGQSAKTYRTWLADDDYRIVWRKEAFGVEMTPAYMACVKVMVPNVGQDWYTTPELERGKPKSAVMWDFVDPARHLQKKLKTAQETCEKHKRLWTKACDTTGIRGIIELFGKVPSAVPLWVKSKLPKKVLEVLTRPPHLFYEDEEECQAPTLPDGPETSQSDPIAISPTLFQNTNTSPSESGPVSPAEAEDGTTTRKTRKTRKTHRARSKGTEVETPSPAPPAEAPAKAPAKGAGQHLLDSTAPPAEAPAKGRKPRVSKPTGKPSKGSKRKPTTTKGSRKSAKNSAKGSRKSKSAPSKN